jgi:pentatricopeptide repeat protein
MPPFTFIKRIFLSNTKPIANVRYCAMSAGLSTVCNEHGVSISVDSNAFASLLESCGQLKTLERGKQVHTQIILTQIEQTVFLSSKLVSMYARCGSLEDARLLFDELRIQNLFSWNTMIAGYARHGLFEEALKFYYRMHRAGVQPDNFTFPRVLKACAGLTALQQGKEIHHYITRIGLESDVFVGNALIDMYAKCGGLEIARQVFDKMRQRDVVSWNAMIAGYSQNGYFGEALTLFYQMGIADAKPDGTSITSALPACAYLGALQQGKRVHGYTVKNGYESNVFVGNAFIDMYSKCGSVDDARQMFVKMHEIDVVSWNAVIAAYGMHGQGKTALSYFSQMQLSSTRPDRITFLNLLSACSHTGLVAEGLQYFDSMRHDYCVIPGVEHYACMVDLLGRSGFLSEAHDFVRTMPMKPNADVWGALLGACRIHCNTILGEYVADQLFELKPENPGYYVLLSNMYAVTGRRHSVVNVRALMKDRGLKKSPGCSWIEVDKSVHTFLVGDHSHPQSEAIYATLKNLAIQMKEAGYRPNTNFALCDDG